MAIRWASVSALQRAICSAANKSTIDAVLWRNMSSSAATANVGFIGLGNMGGHMARNLMKKGHKLHVFDVSPAACAAVQSSGGNVLKSPEAVAEKSDFVITMLPNNDIVYETYKTITQSKINNKTIFIDSSTIDPAVAKNVQKLVKDHGATFVDAPVSGGTMGAENATLTFMVGGTQSEYDAVKGVLEGMGQRIVHCGGSGSGQAAKLCNNMLLGISMIGVCEAMNLAIRLGLDANTFNDIVKTSTGRCWSAEVNNPVPGLSPKAPANNDYNGGFTTELITKDLGLVCGVAAANDVPIPLGSAAHQTYRTLKAHGLGDKDFSVVYQFLQNSSKKN